MYDVSACAQVFGHRACDLWPYAACDHPPGSEEAQARDRSVPEPTRVPLTCMWIDSSTGIASWGRLLMLLSVISCNQHPGVSERTNDKDHM